jgi:hypothetical protein
MMFLDSSDWVVSKGPAISLPLDEWTRDVGEQVNGLLSTNKLFLGLEKWSSEQVLQGLLI